MHFKLTDEWRGIGIWQLIAVIFIGIFGATLISYSTVWGPWVFSDSTVYLTVARNFSDGQGFGLINPSGEFKPLYHYPPLYPMTLSALAAVGLDVLVAARVLNIALFALFLTSLGLSFFYITDSPWLALVSTATVALLPELLKIFSGAMSEPISLFLGFTGMILIVLYIEKGNRILLYCSGIFVGLASIARYIASAYLISSVIALLLLQNAAWRRRIGDSFQYFLVGITPLLAWFIWLGGQKNTARIFHPSADIWADLGPLRKDVIAVIWSWLPFSQWISPLSYNEQKFFLLLISILPIIVLLASLILIKRNNPDRLPGNRTILLGVTFGIFIIAYIAVLAFAYIFTVPQPDIDTRMLLPIHIAGILLVFLLLSYLISSWSNLKVTKYLPIIMLFYLISFLPKSIETLRDYHQAGYGYTSKRWRESETIKAVQELPPKIALVSNEAALLLFYTGRSAYEIPELIYSEYLSEFKRYGDNPDDQGEKLFNENKAALILFDNIYYQFERLDGIHAQERLDAFIKDLNVYAEHQDGTIFFYEPEEP